MKMGAFLQVYKLHKYICLDGLMVRAPAFQSEKFGGVCPIQGKFIIFTLAMKMRAVQNYEPFQSDLGNSKKPAKFPNNSQEQIPYEIGHDSVKCSMQGTCT